MIRLAGTALHAGVPSAVGLERRPGPLVLAQGEHEALVAELSVVRADRGVRVADPSGRVDVDLVEHLFAALGGLGVRDGVVMRAFGPEVPLLDGGARAFADALVALGVPRAAPTLVVAREATFTHGRAVYRMAPADHVAVDVAIAFRAPVGAQTARWAGDPDDFLARIAPARTFGFVEEHAALLASGRARAIDRAAVVVFGPDAPLSGEPADADEPARHKLLDLIGDLALYGGPPRGEFSASWPGHAATHAIVREALATGVLRPLDAEPERATAETPRAVG